MLFLPMSDESVSKVKYCILDEARIGCVGRKSLGLGTWPRWVDAG